MQQISGLLAALAVACVPCDSPRYVPLTRYHLPRRGVKKKRRAKTEANRAHAKRARAARAKNRRA